MSGENLLDVRRRYHNSLTLCETVSCAELATRTAGNNGGVRPALFTTLLVINMEESAIRAVRLRRAELFLSLFFFVILKRLSRLRCKASVNTRRKEMQNFTEEERGVGMRVHPALAFRRGFRTESLMIHRGLAASVPPP